MFGRKKLKSEIERIANELAEYKKKYDRPYAEFINQEINVLPKAMDWSRYAFHTLVPHKLHEYYIANNTLDEIVRKGIMTEVNKYIEARMKYKKEESPLYNGIRYTAIIYMAFAEE